MLETVVSFTADATTQGTVDVVARAFVDRFGTAYERYVTRGGSEFDAGVWYRLEVDGTTPTIRLMVVVPVPVYGLGEFVSRLAAAHADYYSWQFDIRTSVVLKEDCDTKRLEADGWRMLEFPPPSPDLLFSTSPPGAVADKLPYADIS